MLCGGILKAQVVAQMRIDSMLNILPALNDDTSKVKLLNEISFTHFTIDPKQGIQWGNRAEALSKRLNWKKGLAGSYHALGANYWAMHDLQQAQNYYWKCLKINESLGDKTGIAASFHDLATLYETQYNYPKALEYYEKALGLYEGMGDKFSRLGCLANIANVYEVEHDYEKALSYFMQSLHLCVEYGNERHVAYMSGRVGAIYTFQGEYQKALEYELKSLSTLEKFPDKNDIANVLGSIANIYQKQHDYTKSLEYFNKALKLSESVNSNWARGYSAKFLGSIGALYLRMASDTSPNSNGKSNYAILTQKAVALLEKAIKMSGAVGDKESLRDCFQSLSTAKAMQGKPAAALESYKQFIQYKDSLNDLEKDKAMSRHEMEYFYGKQKDSFDYLSKMQQSKLEMLTKEKELGRLTFQQQRLYSVLALVILCLIASFFIFRYRTQQLSLKNQLIREKAEKQLQEAELQNRINEATSSALRSQMNPHFIFNALNTIQSYVYSNNKQKATNYLGKFSDLMRKILENSNKRSISLEEEIELLQLYIDIEKARFGDTFHATINIAQNIDTSEIYIPPMFIQPYAENAIKHGLLHRPGEKKLLIDIQKSADQHDIMIIIDDNGIGREKSMEINNKRHVHHSFANGANEIRLDLINQTLENKKRLEIIDKKNADDSSAGTTVIIRIPIILMAVV